MAEDVEERSGNNDPETRILLAARRLTGEGAIEGDILFPADYTLGILDLGLLLAGGLRGINVRKKPKLLITPTGHELVDIYEQPQEEVKGNKLVDFNGAEVECRRGSSGSGVLASAASAVESAAMGLGIPASVKLCPPGPLMETW